MKKTLLSTLFITTLMSALLIAGIAQAAADPNQIVDSQAAIVSDEVSDPNQVIADTSPDTSDIDFRILRTATLQDVIVIRRYAVDPNNGVMTLLFEASTDETDAGDWMPTDYQQVRTAAMALSESLLKILILDLTTEVENME